MEEENQNSTPIPSPIPTTCWSNVVKSSPAPKPQSQSQSTALMSQLAPGCNSTKGISVAVVDANAVIQGGQSLSNFADKFVTVPEVLAEIRDPVSRFRLTILPFSIEAMEPSPESLTKVVKFARATGDLQTLSDVDLKLIALTYTLEGQIHGMQHLRDAPPPIHTVNVKRLPEKELAGWGSNVPNLEEWESLENLTEDKDNSNSKILPLQRLDLNVDISDTLSVDGSVETKGDSFSEKQDNHGDQQRRRRYMPKKKEVKLEGKTVVNGVDASQGQHDDDAGDWMPAVSRSTHRRFLRRKARREHFDALAEIENQQDQEIDVDSHMEENNGHEQETNDISEDHEMNDGNTVDDVSSVLKQMSLEEDVLPELEEANDDDGDDDEADKLDVPSQNAMESKNGDASYVDDASSEQSWMLRSLSESSVACITGDFAMQNVILQMGLRLLAPGGMQIHQLNRWILKCHACYTVTAEIGRIFCPKCGNGGTLRKVAVTVGENGIVVADRRPRIRIRGTRFSIPLPQGGREAITKNPVLREDQLPQKLLHPKTKKKVYKEGDEFFPVDHIFTHHTDKKAPLAPPVRKALQVFSGKRNPNDNHNSRAKH